MSRLNVIQCDARLDGERCQALDIGRGMDMPALRRRARTVDGWIHRRGCDFCPDHHHSGFQPKLPTLDQ